MTSVLHRALRLGVCATALAPAVRGTAGDVPAGAEDASSKALTEVVVTAPTASASARASVQSSLGAIEPQTIVTQHFIDNFVPVSGIIPRRSSSRPASASPLPTAPAGRS